MIVMMSNRLDEVFINRLNLDMCYPSKNMDNVTGLFLDWVPKIPAYEDVWIAQASLLQRFIKKDIPIVIFDRSFSLTEKEIKWLNKYNVNLFEPALNSGRSGFKYLPEWINDFEILIDDEDRQYDLVYSHHEIEYNIKSFDKWFKDYGRLFPDKTVAYSTFSISDFKKEDYKNNNLVYLDGHHPIYNEGAFTVIIDKDIMYEKGYLDPIYFNAMNLGCLPLLPAEHKYFHGLFKGLVVSNLEDLNFYVSSFRFAKDVVIEEIFERIQKEWPEFMIDHAADTIRNCYE